MGVIMGGMEGIIMEGRGNDGGNNDGEEEEDIRESMEGRTDGKDVDGVIGGLYIFEDVCLTNNLDALRYRPHMETGLRGLLYFTDDETMLSNERRCVPCSSPFYGNVNKR